MIPDDELEISIYPPRQKGGQHVGTSSGVMIVHIPSGLTAISDCGCSQHRNKQIAMDMIIGGLTSPMFRG